MNILDPQLLPNIPPFEVPASPWMTVIENAELVLQLVSLLFT